MKHLNGQQVQTTRDRGFCGDHSAGPFFLHELHPRHIQFTGEYLHVQVQLVPAGHVTLH